MSTKPIVIKATGIVTGVGLDTLSSCAAMRASIDNFQEIQFKDLAGEWIQGCKVPMEEPWGGLAKLVKMLIMALEECVTNGKIALSEVPILLCLSEKNRLGWHPEIKYQLLNAVQDELGVKFHKATQVFEVGRIGGLVAFNHARNMIYQQGFEQVLIAGVDSLLNIKYLKMLEEKQRLLTSLNSNGFVPGEAASVVLVSKLAKADRKQLLLLGQGFAVEPITIDTENLPFKAEGMVNAVRKSLENSGVSMDEVGFRIVDVSGEQYLFKEAALVVAKLYRGRDRDVIPVWIPNEYIGEVGAATVGIGVASIKTAFEKGYDEGSTVLQHCSNDNGQRGAAIYKFIEVR